MNLNDMMRLDALETGGAWVGQLPDFDQATAFKVRKAWNPDYLSISQRLQRPEGEKPLDETEQAAFETILIREAILLDWAGIEDEFNEENVTAYCASKSFRKAILYAANVVGRQGKSSAEEAAKN